MDKPIWPEYQTYTKDHLHAIGTLITQWNMVEWTIEGLLSKVLGTNESASLLIFNSLHNSARFDLLRNAAETMDDPYNSECLKAFVKHCSICNANRNIITHSKYFDSSDEAEIIGLKNRDKDNSTNLYAFSLDGLRQAADETHRTHRFGTNLSRWLVTTDEISSDTRSFFFEGLEGYIKSGISKVKRPVIPAQPKTLNPLPLEDQLDDLNQPQS